MEKYEVKFLQPALDVLEEIVLYIANDSAAAALKIHDDIIEQTKKLETFPRLGFEVPDKKMSRSGFRMIVVSPYILFYRIIGDVIYIYRILHGARNYPMLYNDWFKLK